MNRIALPLLPKVAIILLCGLLSSGWLRAQSAVFIDQAPPDATVDCFGDLPVGPRLRAVLLAGNTPIDTVVVTPTDALSDSLAPCTGGFVIRTWTAGRTGSETTETQRIDFGPATGELTVNEAALPALRDTVDCRATNTAGDPDSYDRWLTDRRLAFARAVSTDCAPITDISDDAPAALVDFSCGDELEVVFTARDLCGGIEQRSFFYRTVDTTGPVILGVDTLLYQLSCTDDIPGLPEVTIEDCDTSAVLNLTQSSTRTPSGCQQYSYTITRTWTAQDGCGNSTTLQQIIEVADNEVPDFRRPPRARLDCTQDFLDLDLTGRPLDVSDNCAPTDSLTVTFTDLIAGDAGCTDNLLIQRTWRVTDPCGNSRVRIQEIRVVDEFAPSFDPPVDSLTVTCGDYTNLAVTGQPTQLFDICDETPSADYEDEITEGNCDGNFTVNRRWRIFDDCGNADFFEQHLTVIDTTPPFFTTAPEDLVGSCNTRFSQQELFDEWLRGFFGASYVDDCVDSAAVTVTIVETGTDRYPTLPELSCAPMDGNIRRLSVDITLSDPCGNATTETVEYIQRDVEPVNVFNCPESQVIPTDPDVCTATVALPPPVIQDKCVSGRPRLLDMRDTVVVTSGAMNPAELGSVPVDPVILNFEIPVPLPVNAESFGTLTISLENADAEGNDEFFNIIGEDGFLIGQTERGTVQCGETVITVDSLIAQKFNRYAIDGVVTIRLEPNVPDGQPGTFAINNLCDGGTVVYGRLTQPTFRLTQIVYEILIDEEPPLVVDPIDTVFVDLAPGLHQIRYRATDCGGNTDECPFTITVEDRQAPTVFCPADIDVVLSDDSCTTTLNVPLPEDVIDNCEPYAVESTTYPTRAADRLFVFRQDPNLNSLQAQPIPVRIEDVPTDGIIDMQVAVEYRGRFDNERAFLDLVTDDGSVLGTSSGGTATCDRADVFTAVLTPTQIGSLRQPDGSITLHLRPRPVPVPPGQPGNGVLPCSVIGDGQTDGVSGASATVSLRFLRPTFSTAGATVTPETTTSAAAPVPVINFNRGLTVVTYAVTDPSGNTGSCDFRVTVRDTTAPTVVCRPTTVFVDPSGLGPGVLEPAAVDGGSTDNCTLETFSVSPREFDCDRYGDTETVTLEITDIAGNSSSCTTIVSIAPLAPTPTANLTECDGTDLQLTANPPTVAEPGQTIYTFRWFDPAGNLISTEENPIIRGVDPDDSGVYRLEIRGLTGCVSEALVSISIGAPLVAPTLVAPRNVCTGDQVTLRAEGEYAGATTAFEWFRGPIGGGVSLGTTDEPEFTADLPEGTDTGDFYVVALVSGCPTPPSGVSTVSFAEQPTAVILGGQNEFCELGTLELLAVEMPGLGYAWTGPNGYTSDERVAVRPNLSAADGGVYSLRTVRGGGCFSEPVSETVTILPASPTPDLTGDGFVCTSDTLVLNVTGIAADTYTFTNPQGTDIVTADPQLRVAPVGPNVAGAWTVRLQVGDCPSRESDPLVVQLFDSPVATTRTLPDPVCAGNDLILQGGSNLNGSTYRWSGPNGFTSDNIAPIIENVDSTMAGTYVLSVTSPSGCSDRASLEVDVLPGIRIDTIMVAEGRCLNGGETVAIVANISPSLAADGDYTYRWTGPEGTSSGDTLFVPNVSLASNGTYTLMVSNADGCNSPVYSQELELDFAPSAPLRPFSADGDYLLCGGEGLTLETNDFGDNATYVWRLPDGTNIPTTENTLQLDSLVSGNYTVRVVRNGCASLPSEARIITVTEFPVITASSDGIACAGQPINFQATDLPGATYVWTGPNNFSSSLPNPTIARADPDVHAGRYSVVATINGCSSEIIFLGVEVLPTPAVPVAQPILPFCLDDAEAELRLAVNPNTTTEGATYIWTINDGQTVVGDPTTDLELVVTDLGLFTAGGTFDFRVQASLDGCVSEPSTVVNVRLDRPGTVVADAGPDTVVCAGLYLLEAAPVDGVTGQWSLVEGTGDIAIINPTSNITAVTGMSEFGGPYAFAWTLSNGACRDYAADTVRITVTDGEEAVVGEDFIACVREETRLSATAPVQNGSAGQWSQAQAQELLGIVIVDPNDPNTEITGLQPDNIYSFTWTVRSNCGVKSDNVLVNVSDPTPFAGDDDEVCNGNRTGVLVADEPTLGSSGRWRSVDEVAIVTDPESATSMVSNLAEGENRFVWEIDEGRCGDRSRDTVSIFYRMPAEARDDEVSVAFQGAATFDPSENDINLDGADIRFPSAPARGQLTDNGDGTYTFTAPPNTVGEISVDYEVASPGCSVSTATVFFVIGDDAECRAPNIFTPNNDGVNDFFVVPCLLDGAAFPESQVTIYNEWGDEVFRSGTPYQNNWDGTYQGSELPVGTYFYLIDFGGTRERASGHVRIER